MAIFVPKPWVKPFTKMATFRLFELLVFIPQKCVFSFQNILKDILLPCFALKKRSCKNGYFWTKTTGSLFFLFAKMAIFRLFELPFLKPTNAFFILEYRKTNFPSLYCPKKKKLKKRPFLDQNHWVTPLEKWQFFDFLNFLFLQPRKPFFRSRIS